MDDSDPTRERWVREAMARHEQPLVAYAARITGNLETARDVVQDAFLKLCTADRAKLDGRLAPWLYTVCRNRALDVRRKERRMTPLTTQQAEQTACPAPAPREAAARLETRARLAEAIAQLPEDDQDVFRLKFGQDLSYREISEITGLSLAVISKRIHRALRTLREQLHGSLGAADLEG